ncbi:MAG TPA: peptidoglycan editing factor PgeF [Beijerinckiaceae bacterium]|nr:peptidoglycan editing factor PgeF [Beijerinckiaceae bacterium]
MSEASAVGNPSTAVSLRAAPLELPGLAHGFFTRAGGLSQGLYATLNGGLGSDDDPAAVAENHRRMARALGNSRLLLPYQIHSEDVLRVTEPWASGERPRVDGLVTGKPGLAIGVTGADCGMLLFADAAAHVIGAAHAGWKGALGGIVEATVDAMVAAGATRNKIVAVLGPTIGPRSYEVGPEFIDRFLAHAPGNARFFDGRMFDLPAYIGMRAEEAGIGSFTDLALDTYADEARFFSYRRTTHRREADYGRLVSAIALV